MKNLLLATVTTTTLQLVLANDAEAAQVKEVTFDSNNQTLVGDLYLPDEYQEGDKLPGVLVTRAWTTGKEQMPAIYAESMANRGYAVLADELNKPVKIIHSEEAAIPQGAKEF
ncbi:MAG: hypothetical protein AAF298_06090 [Cyanobacteria bacterium P01_A01_bin.40]